MTINDILCPLCQSIDVRFFDEDNCRKYFICSECALVFTPKEYFLDFAEEKKRYDLHRNDPEDQQYRNFLNQLFEPVCKLLPEKAEGLDFGCGPGPTLSVMFQEVGFEMSLYDPFYAADEKILTKTYNFITCSEVAEHLHQPYKVFCLIDKMLKTGGVFGVMTNMYDNVEYFAKWHYKRDLTHVCFYSRKSFEWLSSVFSWNLTFISSSVVIFVKSNTGKK